MERWCIESVSEWLAFCVEQNRYWWRICSPRGLQPRENARWSVQIDDVEPRSAERETHSTESHFQSSPSSDTLPSNEWATGGGWLILRCWSPRSKWRASRKILGPQATWWMFLEVSATTPGTIRITDRLILFADRRRTKTAGPWVPLLPLPPRWTTRLMLGTMSRRRLRLSCRYIPEDPFSVGNIQPLACAVKLLQALWEVHASPRNLICSCEGQWTFHSASSYWSWSIFVFLPAVSAVVSLPTE